MPWLQKWNPQVDWLVKTLTLPHKINLRDIEPQHECLSLGTESTILQRYLLRWLEMDTDLKTTWRLQKWECWHARETIGKITISTQIAQGTQVQEATLPDWCKDFQDIFSEKTHDKLPLHRPYDHVINLKPTFIPKITKVYSLNPQELETYKAFVQEHLKTRHIIPSKNLQASPFFFVPKKDGTLCPCQDYWYLNSHTNHNAYPLPLFPELIMTWKTPPSLPSSTYIGATIISTWERKTNGRPLS